jgi:hypothetical protein
LPPAQTAQFGAQLLRRGRTTTRSRLSRVSLP